jgi:hypothetical protein
MDKSTSRGEGGGRSQEPLGFELDIPTARRFIVSNGGEEEAGRRGRNHYLK